MPIATLYPALPMASIGPYFMILFGRLRLGPDSTSNLSSPLSDRLVLAKIRFKIFIRFLHLLKRDYKDYCDDDDDNDSDLL